SAHTVTGSGCAVTGGPLSASVCDTLDAEVDATGLPLGWVSLSVDNPDPASCGPVTTTIEVRAPPRIESVSPDSVCTEGGALTVTGADLRDDTVVTVGGVEAEVISYIDSSTIVVALGAGMPSGTQDVSVTSPGGCVDTLPEALDVVSAPFAFYAAPAILPTGTTAEIEVFIANVIADIVDVWLEDDAGLRWEADWSVSADSSVLLTVPDNLPDGEYAVGVSLEGSCGGTSSALIEIVDTPLVALDSIDPPFAWTFDRTAVEIFTQDPVPSGMTDFSETPTATLISASGETTALRGIVYREAGRLTATVPDSLTPGAYDLLVENPDGSIGLLEDALSVTVDAPPTLSAVRPLSLSSSQDTEISISGQDFRDPTVSLDCRDGGVLVGTVLSWSYGQIEAEVPSSSFGQTVCVVEVHNSDGTMGRYASVSVTNPSQNLFPWSTGSALNVARRAPAVTAGRLDPVSRYLYAIGGDDGSASGALGSIEQAEIGVYGDMGAWSLLTGALPGPVSRAGVQTIGRFVYLAGGDGGSGATDAVWRAEILSQDSAPELSAPTVFLGAAGLTGGDWRYAVSALYAADDDNNPGGESLASERLVLRLPPHDDAYRMVLRWSSDADAIGYRVYRSVSASDDTLGWIADVTDPTFTDLGDPADASQPPLAAGALGEWAEVAAMTTPRSGACMTLAADPTPDPETLYLYVAGGEDDAGSVLDSIERLDVRVASLRQHVVGSWSEVSPTLIEARHSCGAYVVSSQYHALVEDGESWVFFAGGVDEDGRATGTVDAGQVGEGGDLEDWQESDGMSPSRAGFGAAAASDSLYAFGGQQNRASASGTSAALEEPLPSLSNWNSLGTSLSESRLLPGSAQESSVIFVVGGETDTSGATTSTDWTNY
ncbi:MAG: hypothetical protein ACI8S6_004926, partial [Myxococcota bacterium]